MINIQPTFVAKNHIFRGPNESKKLNESERENRYDHIKIAQAINSISNDLMVKAKSIGNQAKSSREYIDAFHEQEEIDRQYSAIEGVPHKYYQTMRSFKDIVYDTGSQSIDEARRLRVDPLFGEATLPYNGVKSLFFSRNFIDDQIIPSTNLVVAVASIDEGVGEITQGEVLNAFNGANESFWLRQIKFPLDSDKESVTVRLDITVPTTFSSVSNLLHIRPAIPGWIDIVDLKYSTTAADPSIDFPGFSAVNDLAEKRYIFAPTPITKISVTLRSRHFVQENARKVFMIGLEEIALELVEFDKTFNPSQLLDNNAVITKVDAAPGYKFDNITNFISNPTYAVSPGDLGIYHKIFTDAGLTDLVWYSFSDPNPLDAAVDILSKNTSTLYVVTMLEYSNSLSIPPVLRNLSLKYTTQAL